MNKGNQGWIIKILMNEGTFGWISVSWNEWEIKFWNEKNLLSEMKKPYSSDE